MKLDPLKMKDWEIALAAEETLLPIGEIAQKIGLLQNEWLPYGHYLAKVDAKAVEKRVGDKGKQARYIDVTAITPTALGEGKTTTLVGLVDGLAAIGKRVIGTVRQPSGGPTFNIKGSATGGGLAQVVPSTELSLGLTGDIDAVTNANNLAMVALSSRMQHERNYDDERLAKSHLTRLDIDPQRVQMRWAMDFCAQALRNIEIGRGGKMDGFQMDSGFYISVASEVMAILAMSRDLADLRRRIGKVVVAFSKSGKPVTTADLEVDGAMAAWLVRAINPTLMQTLEGNPMLVHAGPFANIAIGQSSVIADILASRLTDYVVTESGFASDIGFEKFWNIKCRCTGLKPDAVVLVATIRALKAHGGAPAVKAGQPLDPVYTHEALEPLTKGCENLLAHISIIKRAGVTPVVCLNHFYTDTPAEEEIVRRVAEEAGARFAVSNHWQYGGEGAKELAQCVAETCETQNEFRYLSDLSAPLKERIETIVAEVYGGDGVVYTEQAEQKLAAFQSNSATAGLPICMAKTQYSLSDNPALLGRPKGWKLTVRDVLLYEGAGLIVPVAGDIKLMPGTASNAAYRGIDIDADTGKVKGLF
ncbi:MAG: formate--tetrahydrofolate ligase [Kiritimatiellae bacterium]|nr:formate--tetrahydrofolate ligase [Kiritimatiellia bacterium]